jgi:hypothetical protein
LAPSLEDIQDTPASTAAYKVASADLRAQLAAAPGRPPIVGAPFAHAFGAADDDGATFAAIPPEQAGEALVEMRFTGD